MTSVPLGFAIGASPGPRLGARDPEGHDALETLARDGVNLIRLPAIDPRELEGITPGAGPLPPSVQTVADNLDWAQRAGRATGRPVYVAINLGELSAQDGSDTRRRWLDYVVQRFQNHPATGVWKILDEPNNPYTPDDKERPLRVALRRGYARLRELDPRHPAWVTQAPQPPRRLTRRYFRAYQDTADIFAVDLYPVSDPPGKHSGIRNKRPSAVGDFAARLSTVARECTAAGTPRWVWMVLQGAAWSGVIPRDERRRPIGPCLMQPPAHMVRFMTYQSIIHGAQGLLYFGMTFGLHPDSQPYGWDWGYWRGAVLPTIRELRTAPLSDALAAAGHQAAGPPRTSSLDSRAVEIPKGGAVRLEARRERRRKEPLVLDGLLPWEVRLEPHSCGSPVAEVAGYRLFVRAQATFNVAVTTPTCSRGRDGSASLDRTPGERMIGVARERRARKESPTMVTILRDTDAVKRALAAGHLSVPDPETGYHRSMYADCPAGHAAAVHRIMRLHYPQIAELSMRCATCGAEFTAPVETIYLKQPHKRVCTRPAWPPWHMATTEGRRVSKVDSADTRGDVDAPGCVPFETGRSRRLSVTRRRRFALGVALSGPVALAAACAGQETPGGAGTTSRPARISIAIPSAPQEQTQTWFRNSQRLHERYPTIDVEDMPNMSGEKILALFAADSPPDVLNLVQANGPGNTEDLASRGLLLNLDDRARRDKALKWDDIWPAARNAGIYQNALIALPGGNGITAALMFYNKELFAAAGRPTPDRLLQQGQWTWDRVVTEAPQLTKRNDDGSLLQAGIGYPWFVDVWNVLLLRCYGADFMNKDGTRVVINTPAATRALQVAYELAPRRKTMPLRGEGNSTELVRNGRIAAAVYWMAAASWWRTTPFDWDVAPTPAGPAGRPTAAKVGQMVIARNTKEPDAAWLYTSLVLSPEVEVANAIERGNVALRQSNLPAWRQGMGTQRPHNLNLVEETAKAITIDGLRTATAPLVQVEQLFLREMQALYYDGKPPERVVDTLATEGNTLLGVK